MYVGSKDGFSSKDFHGKCDKKPNTLVLIKANNYWFGGYTTYQWGTAFGWSENKGKLK